MTKRITAIRRYKPEIERERTLQMPDIIRDMTRSTGLSHGEILHVIYQLQEAILEAHRLGRAVKIEGLGTFTPVIRMDGSLDILFRPHVEILRQLNDWTKFYAKILNKANIGKSSQELIAQWDRDHPDDPVEE
jgi:HU domain-containing protein